MNNPTPADRQAILSDLLSEKSLWAVYVRSRAIPFSWLNNSAGLAIGVAIFFASCWANDVSNIADHLLTLATLAFNTSISLLGFLLAGFSFFATVSDKSMFCRMAEIKHRESGLSYLKYNFYVFMRVFFEYSVVAVVAFLVAVVLQTNSGTRIAFLQLLDATLQPDFRIMTLSGVLGLLAGSCAYLLLQLKSFIFNVFHVVMTSIRWAIEEEYEQTDAARVATPDSVSSPQSHHGDGS
jgi:hypothetical protein